MRRANGTGTIVKLSGNRRRPYVVKISVVDKWGRMQQKTLSYHSKMVEAQEALDAYNHDKAAGLTPRADKYSVTLQQIYDLWSPRKYTTISRQAADAYRACWGRLSRYNNMRVADLTIDHLQSIIDEDAKNNMSQSTMQNDKMLTRALFKYAMERDIIMKDYSAFVEVPSVAAKYEKGAFDDLQMAKLEQLARGGFPWADTVLMLCYTGFRINEFLKLTPFSYDRAEDFLRGGSKTEAGKDRVIPIHPKIKPYLEGWLSRGGESIICKENGKPVSYAWYLSNLFKSVVEELGVPQATPHWCRHTFATRLHEAGAPDLEIKRLMGHADSNVTEHYTHTDLEHLRSALLLLA
ncbi:tyrosine-type recombinase/integrase [Oscillibacter sp.]|uniref:tyrosine-type recombinase/integrase n=1 Tax=Oscillibacter sp. TaxID=1945593 RepID=UPI0033914FF9